MRKEQDRAPTGTAEQGGARQGFLAFIEMVINCARYILDITDVKGNEIQVILAKGFCWNQIIGKLRNLN